MKSDSVRAILHALNEAGARYLIVGGLAVVAHGYVRYTVDLDLVIALDPANVRRSTGALAALGYRPRAPVRLEDFADAAIREAWVRDKAMVVFQVVSDVHPETSVDIFTEIPFDFETQFARSHPMHLPEGLNAPVLALDALIEMKRAVARAQDLLDIEQLEKLL